MHSLTTRGWWPRTALTAAVVTTVGCGASRVFAQERFASQHSVTVTPVFESWSFGDGLAQTTLRGDVVRITRATRWSLPVTAAMRFGERWQLDAGAAVVDGRVSLDSADRALNVSEYSLSGVTDVKLALTAHVVPDHVLVTVGVNLAPGGSSLDPEELEAVRVFAAPALGFEVPSMGLGRAATAGVVLARQLGRWAWAFGGSYEMRSGSTPLVVTSGFPALDFNPSDAVHLSVGTEGLVGPHAMTFGVSADLFSDDDYSSGGQSITAARTRLGPIFTGEWQFRLATQQLREVVIFVTDRYRTEFSRSGEKVPDSNANYLDVGASGVAPISPRTGVVGGLVLRHHTGLKADSSVASAAASIGSATVGLRQQRGNYVFQPFVRAQFGRLDTRRSTADATEIVGGVSITTRF